MDYKFIRPLYTDDDIEDAKEMIVRNMIENSSNTAMYINDDDGNGGITSMENFPKEILHTIFNGLAEALYGVNIPLIANYMNIQNTFNRVYKNSILKYLNNVDIDGFILDTNPSALVPYLINDEKLKNIEPQKRLNPEIKWDARDIKFKTVNSLAHPLVTFDHTYLYLKNIKNIEFLKSIYGKDYDNIIRDGKIPSELIIKILPSDSYFPIMHLVNCIHKYF